MLRVLNRGLFNSQTYCKFSSTPHQVLHDKELKEFSLGEGKVKAVLTYKEISPSIILLEHTVVPESLQGKGIGKFLAEAAFGYAIDKQIKVKISCGFVQKYLEKNPKPEFQSVLAKD